MSGTYFGVDIHGAGTVTNADAAGLISGYSGGAYVGQAVVVANIGTIELSQIAPSSLTFGLEMADGGSVINGATNVASSLVYGDVAIFGKYVSSTITNYGTIASATAGGFGVELAAGGTVIDAGTISGNTAIEFGGFGGDLVVLEHGYAIKGAISAPDSGNTLELLGSASAAVTANYNSLGLSGFQTVEFAPGAGAYATLKITDDVALPGTIAGFINTGDTIDLTGLSDAGNDAVTNFDTLTNMLTITADEGASVTFQLDPSGSYAGLSWLANNDGSNGTAVTLLNSAPPPNTPPTISTPPAYVGVATGGSDQPSSTIVVTDTSPSATDTVTVSLASPAAGTLSDVGGGSFDPTTGVYAVSGTPAEVNADLAELVFVPAALSSGRLGTTDLQIAVTGPGGSVGGSTSVTTVKQVLGLGAIAAADIVVSVSPDGSGLAAFTSDMTNEAVILDPTADGSYTLPTGYAAEFLGGTVDASLTDLLVGGAVLIGNSGNDTLTSGASNDTLLGGGGVSSFAFTAGASHGVVVGVGAGTVAMTDAGSYDTMIGGTGTAVVTLSGAHGLFFSEAGNASVSASGNAETLVGGSSQSNFQFTSGATGGVVFGGVGGIDISDAGNHDTVVGSTGTLAATISGADGLFFSQTGNDSVVASGQGDVLVGGSNGSTFAFTSGASDGVVFGEASGVSMTDAGSHDTIVGGSGAAAATISGSDALFFSETGIDSVIASGTGDVLIGGSNGSTFQFTSLATGGLVFGGSGGVAITDAGTHDTLAGGSGAMSVTTSGLDALVFSETGNDTVTASGHGDELVGGSNQSTFQFTSLAEDGLAFGGGGRASFTDAGGHDTLAGAADATAVTLSGSDATFFTEFGRRRRARPGRRRHHRGRRCDHHCHLGRQWPDGVRRGGSVELCRRIRGGHHPRRFGHRLDRRGQRGHHSVRRQRRDGGLFRHQRRIALHRRQRQRDAGRQRRINRQRDVRRRRHERPRSDAGRVGQRYDGGGRRQRHAGQRNRRARHVHLPECEWRHGSARYGCGLQYPGYGLAGGIRRGRCDNGVEQCDGCEWIHHHHAVRPDADHVRKYR